MLFPGTLLNKYILKYKSDTGMTIKITGFLDEFSGYPVNISKLTNYK